MVVICEGHRRRRRLLTDIIIHCDHHYDSLYYDL